MALLFMDGFDVGDFALKWTSHGNVASNTTTRFSSGRSMNTPNSTSGSFFGSVMRYIPASSKIFLGVAFNPAALLDGTKEIIALFGDSGTTEHLSLITKASGAIALYRGSPSGTLLATSSAGQLIAAGWVYIEVSATIADSGGTCVVRVNGVEVINFTGGTKNAGTNSTIDAVQLAGYTLANTSNVLWDDFYLCDDTGSVNNTFLGDVRVQTLLPTGAGASTQFTPSVGSNWDNVNDAPYVSTTYNSSATVGNRDTYAMSDLLSGTGTVFGVQDNLLALKSDAGTASIKAAIKSGGTVYYDSTVSLGTALGATEAVREVDPATSAAWTVTNVNALEFGAEVA
jgi:hypothetical protein